MEVQVTCLKGTFYSFKVLKYTFAGWRVTTRPLKLSQTTKFDHETPCSFLTCRYHELQALRQTMTGSWHIAVHAHIHSAHSAVCSLAEQNIAGVKAKMLLYELHRSLIYQKDAQKFSYNFDKE